MKAVIDLNKLFNEAMLSMSAPNDCRWSLGNALLEIYYKEFGKELEEKMMKEYLKDDSK